MAEHYSGAQIENLITILAHDDKHGKIVAQLIEPQLFQGIYRDIAERLVAYWKKYKKAPGLHTADLFSDIIEAKDSRLAVSYKRVLRNMRLAVEGINVEYVLRTLKETSRRQKMKDALLKAAEFAQQDNVDLDQGEKILSDFVRARDFQFDKGLRLTEVDRVIDYFDAHYSEFTTGIDLLDKGYIVPARDEVILFIAPTRRGKSWWLSHLGKHALLQRKRVLHITLEMSEEQVAGRYYQSLFALPKHLDEEIERFSIRTDERGNFVKTGKSKIFTPKITLAHKRIRSILKHKLEFWVERRMAQKLIIKRFPPRRLSMDMLASYIDTLEASEGFIPDLIVLDYIGITKTDANNLRNSLGRSFEDFRALCIDYHAAGATAQQSSKAGEESYQVKIGHVAEDWSLIGTADVALTFSQTLEERKRGLARLWVDKARGEGDNWGMIITQNYATGQFVLQSARLNQAYDKMVEGLTRRAKDEKDED